MIYLLAFFSADVVLSLEANVPYLTLNDGNKIPAIAFGTGGSLPDQDETGQGVREAVALAIEAGYRHFDTASIYGTEEEVGRGIQDALDRHVIIYRKQLFITTKLWNNRHHRHQVVPALKASLAKLGTHYVDLYLIHSPIAVKDDNTPSYIDFLETWEGMRDAKALGLTVSIGVANFNITQIDRLARYSNDMPVVLQTEVSPTLTEINLVKHCQNIGIVVMATSPFGYMVNRGAQYDSLPGPHQSLEDFTKTYGKTREQIILRYLVDRNIIPVPKTKDPVAMQQYINIFDHKIYPTGIAYFNNFNINMRIVTMSAFKNYPNYPFNKQFT